MSGVNKVILVGRLGKDPEVRSLDSGVKVASFSLATSEKYKDKNSGEMIETTEWHNVTLWRQLAELTEKYLKKGNQIYLEGKLQTRSYEQEGITKYRTDIIGNQIQFLGSAGDSSGSAAPASAAPAPDANDGAKDDLPF